MTTQLYTHSRLRVLRQCLRLHFYRYTLGIRFASTRESEFGTVGHAALEAWYRAWMAGDVDGRLSAALAVTDQLPSPFDQIKLRLLVIAYHELWGGQDWEVLGVEVEFRYQLGEHIIGGKIDAIIRNRADGRVYVVEHKFTGSETSLGGSYWERLTLDAQVSIYIDGATMLGHEVAGCIYDVIKRPEHEQKLATPVERREYTKGKGCKGCGGSGGGKAGIVQGRGYYVVQMPGEPEKQNGCPDCKGTGWLLDKDGEPQAPRLHSNQRAEDEAAELFEERLLGIIAEAPDSWLQRSVVVRLEQELPAMRIDLMHWISVAELATRLGDEAPRNPEACVRGHWICDAFAICTGQAPVDTFSRGPAHPELGAAT